MKIFFEDDSLVTSGYLAFNPTHTIDAKIGYTNCVAQLDFALRFDPQGIVYTNSLAVLMDSKYFWNKELGVPELYLRSGEYMVFNRIDKLTERELKETHNYLKLFTNNEFGTLS